MEQRRVIRWNLAEILEKYGLSQTEACRHTGLTAQQMAKLCSMRDIDTESKLGVEFSTLERLCTRLHISISDLIQLEPIRFLDLIHATGERITIYVGGHLSYVLHPGDIVRGKIDRLESERIHDDMVGHSDIYALAEVTQRDPLRPPKIKIMPSAIRAREDKLPEIDYESLQGGIIGLGGPLSSGFADRLLHDLSRYYELPFKFSLHRIEVPEERMNSREYISISQDKEGILWREEKEGVVSWPNVVQVPLWEEIAEIPTYYDGCILVVWPTTRKGQVWIALAMGVKGNGTLGGTPFLFDDKFGEILSAYFEYLENLDFYSKVVPPLSLALKVKCQRQGEDPREVYPVKKGDGFDFEVLEYEYRLTRRL